MRISVRGWGRDSGPTKIMDRSIVGAPEHDEDGKLSVGSIYKKVLDLNDRRTTRVSLSGSAELRLGGNYLLKVELTRKEIAELFYETHSGSLVRMIRAFIDEEDDNDRADQLARIAKMREERARRIAAIHEEEQAAGDVT